MNHFSLLYRKRIVQMFLHCVFSCSVILLHIVLVHIDQDLFICVIVLGRGFTLNFFDEFDIGFLSFQLTLPLVILLRY
jgi:hypothetical protein